jgi:hypothetical protein
MYVDQKLPFVQNLKNDTQILWLAQFHWRHATCNIVDEFYPEKMPVFFIGLNGIFPSYLLFHKEV